MSYEIQTDKKGLIEYIEKRFKTVKKVIDDNSNLFYKNYSELEKDKIYIVKNYKNKKGFNIIDENGFNYGTYETF